MIIVRAESMGKWDTFSISADGHANAARNEENHDLVCCAVSTLMGTLANSCARIEDVNTIYQSSHGHALVTVTNIPEEIWHEIASRFTMAMDGLEGLAEQYPDSLRIDQ